MRDAILLIGPTGSGKTPLGNLLAAEGFEDRHCVHFDFGANLRRVAALERPPAGFGWDDMAIIRDALEGGALLENENFHVARRIFEHFCCEHAPAPQTQLILNGLPRHIGQAADMAKLTHVHTVICLHCSAETVHRRIARNTGGDRTHRVDDGPDKIAEKLRVYETRTALLLDFYRPTDATIHDIQVEWDTRGEDIVRHLRTTSSTDT